MDLSAIHGANWAMKRTLLVIAALLLASVQAYAGQDELARLNAQILRDPTNVELSLRYARTAEERGDYEKAFAAYERVLEYEPGNAEARNALQRSVARLAPNTFQVFTEFGGGYESNPHNFSMDRHAEGLLFGRVLLKDERTFWDTRWRTTALFSGNVFWDSSDLNYGYAAAATGPVYVVTPNMTVHPSIGAGAAYFDHHFYYSEAFATLLFEGSYDVWNYTVRYRAGYRDYDDFFPATHGMFGDVTMKFSRPSVLFEDDLFVFSPWARWSGINAVNNINDLVSPDDFRTGKYGEGGVRFEYYKPIMDWVTASVNFAYVSRNYARSLDIDGVPFRRRDEIYAPGAALIFRNVFAQNPSTLRFDYRYERDDSNAPLGSYTNNVFTVTLFNRY